MSAIEIYNEKVRDLLKDGTERQNLPLLDDPERGTVAEGLSEEWPRSEQHLCQLLRQIEARRTVRPHPTRLRGPCCATSVCTSSPKTFIATMRSCPCSVCLSLYVHVTAHRTPAQAPLGSVSCSIVAETACGKAHLKQRCMTPAACLSHCTCTICSISVACQTSEE